MDVVSRILYVLVIMGVVVVVAYFGLVRSGLGESLLAPFSGNYARPISEDPALVFRDRFDPQIYFVELNVRSDTRVSCRRELRGVRVDVDESLRSNEQLRILYERMLSYPQRTIESAHLLNPLFSSGLSLEEVTVDGVTARVRLTGNLVSDPLCEGNRAIDQLEKIALQYPQITAAEILVNGEKVN